LQKGESLKILGIVLCKLALFAAAIVPVALYLRSDRFGAALGFLRAHRWRVYRNIVFREKGKGDR
jgi:hypothetical protein